MPSPSGARAPAPASGRSRSSAGAASGSPGSRRGLIGAAGWAGPRPARPGHCAAAAGLIAAICCQARDRACRAAGCSGTTARTVSAAVRIAGHFPSERAEYSASTLGETDFCRDSRSDLAAATACWAATAPTPLASRSARSSCSCARPNSPRRPSPSAACQASAISRPAAGPGRRSCAGPGPRSAPAPATGRRHPGRHGPPRPPGRPGSAGRRPASRAPPPSARPGRGPRWPRPGRQPRRGGSPGRSAPAPAGCGTAPHGGGRRRRGGSPGRTPPRTAPPARPPQPAATRSANVPTWLIRRPG